MKKNLIFLEDSRAHDLNNTFVAQETQYMLDRETQSMYLGLSYIKSLFV